MPPSGIEVAASSYVDPNGFVFRYNGGLYRAIYPRVEAFYRSLFDDGTIERLRERCSLVPSRIADLQLPETGCNLILEHETIWPLSYCTEWCASMLASAARNLIELSLELSEHDYMLQDAYPWNVVFRGSTPVFVDLTSLVRVDPHLIWPAYLQFKSFFLRPLEACRQGRGKLARALLYDNIDGIGLEDFYQITSTGYKLAHPSLMLERWLERKMRANPEVRRKLRSAATSTRVTVGAEVRRAFFKRLLAKMRRFRFASRVDPWSGYYRGIDPRYDTEAKLSVVQHLLDRFEPKTVLDLGCNTGVFSLVAARKGAHVVSVDSSEACIETLYAEAAAKQLPVTPLVADVLCPTPAFGFLGTEYPSLADRARADVVLCLALMHHLHITGRQPFERIAALMDRVTANHLIFEFVANDDANNSLLSLSRPIGYTLQTVMSALRRHFPVTETLDSDRPTRRIIVCSR